MITDREIDALVAEKIMGLRIYSHEWPCGFMPDSREYEAARIDNPNGYPNLFTETDVVYGVYATHNDTELLWVEPVPFYSTDIDMAWLAFLELIKKYEDQYYHVYFNVGRELKRWDVDISCAYKNSSPSDWDIDVVRVGESESRTICLALLEAEGIHIDGD